MWMKNSIEPEEFNYQTMEVVSPGYPLRPEIVESTYYLYHYALLGARTNHSSLGARTARPHASFRRGTRPSHAAQVPPLNQSSRKLDADYYQRMGAMMFQDFVKYCRTDEGYAALKSVVTKEQTDSMQSFLFAETFKYFYLLFSPPRTLDFDKVIFNTEAHPIRRSR
jgi:mannosidase alpha-like ER degradation enhancer 2